jgi:hypothetical protein
MSLRVIRLHASSGPVSTRRLVEGNDFLSWSEDYANSLVKCARFIVGRQGVLVEAF